MKDIMLEMSKIIIKRRLQFLLWEDARKTFRNPRFGTFFYVCKKIHQGDGGERGKKGKE
jgi:hypothetical protein